MPVLQANSISYQFPDGEFQFQDLSFSFTERRVGLVGRNGSGKSLLISLLTGLKQPTTGSVMRDATLGVYSQLPSELRDTERSVAAYLGFDKVLEAIEQIESGRSDQKWFDLVGEQWDLKQTLSHQLSLLGLPVDPGFLCRRLSGGQLALLQLWQLFRSKTEVLILDEPSNHLDTAGRTWLINQMNHFPGHILLVSHDRQLLRQMNQIWELSSLGLNQYGGNYDFYRQQKDQELYAVERQLKSVRKEQKELEVQAQRNREKAQQRAAKGEKIRKEGGQPKILLNGMRDSATASVSSLAKNERGRRENLCKRESDLMMKQEQLEKQRMYLSGREQKGRVLVKITDGILPFGSEKPVRILIDSRMKLHLKGSNGSGKSTLLNILRGKASFECGELTVNASLCYLDQHFSLLENSKSLLENLCSQCGGLSATDARTLLAGIGFRRDRVHRFVNDLSGGEKMKLSMLIVSNQSRQPLLLLDEPDNHLDIESKQLLADTLKQYQGAFILVSHDSDFVAESGVSDAYTLD